MSSRTILRALFATLLVIAAYRAAFSLPTAHIPRHPVRPVDPGTFPDEWVNGTDCPNTPIIQVHAYNDDFYILRQSKCSHYEAPFLYLIFGEEKAILIDTGSATALPLREAVDRVVREWLERRGLDSIELVVAHTHSHLDHILGDGQFVDRPNTVIVGTFLAQMRTFFGFTNWPEEIVSFDLGGRVLDVIPTPGHRGNDIAFYDTQTRILVSGDTLYPGFLFIFARNRWTQYMDSIDRLARFGSVNPIRWILGGHVEMTATPGVAYPYSTPVQPDERELQLTFGHLLELQDALMRMSPDPQRAEHVVFDDFILTPNWIPQ